MLSLIDMIEGERNLNETMVNLLVGRTVRIKGSVESGDFDLVEMINEIEYVKKVTGSGKCNITSIYDVKIGPSPNGNLLDFSCISMMGVARCSDPNCGSELGIEKHEDDESLGLWCSKCGKVISEALGDWVVYRVDTSTEKVRLLRV